MRRFRFFLAALMAEAGRAAAGDEAAPEITAAELLGHVRSLASDEWEGRGSGTPGEQRASAYVADAFAKLGLKPLGADGGFFQPVRMPGAFRAKPGCLLRFAPAADGEPLALELEREWLPLSASPDADAEGEIVFAGYGVRAGELSYDDYAGIDVRGKVVVVFRHTPTGPWWREPQSRFRHAPLATKLRHAVELGAVALIVANDPASFRGEGGVAAGGRPPVPERDDIGAPPSTIPFLHLTLAGAERLFAAAFDASPAELEERIHGEDRIAPASRAGRGRLRMRVEAQREILEGRNVCALLEAGAHDATEEIIVLGAHHDHLGRGGRGSLARTPEEQHQIHNGADDNASGVAGVLEIAEHLASRRAGLRRSVLFLTFTGEERGLLGSLHFVAHPPVPLSRVAAMVNLDMIGRLEGRKLFVGGVKTSPAFGPLVGLAAREAGVEVLLGDGGRAPSDSTSFYSKRVPVLFLFSGMHPDYHRPSDDPDKVDGAGAEQAARLGARLVEELARLPERPAFVRADFGGTPPRAVLGIVAEAVADGVRIARMGPDAPVARAGFELGDVIMAVGGEPTSDLSSLSDALQRREPGDKVKVRVRRGAKEIEAEVTLGRG
jgi:hypothetical protein